MLSKLTIDCCFFFVIVVFVVDVLVVLLLLDTADDDITFFEVVFVATADDAWVIDDDIFSKTLLYSLNSVWSPGLIFFSFSQHTYLAAFVNLQYKIKKTNSIKNELRLQIQFDKWGRYLMVFKSYRMRILFNQIEWALWRNLLIRFESLNRIINAHQSSSLTQTHRHRHRYTQTHIHHTFTHQRTASCVDD